MSAYDVALTSLYRARGFLDARGQPQPIPTTCANHASCWRGEVRERAPKPGSPASEISAPWIGERYDSGRLVVVLENLREFGGWDLTGDAKKGMRYLGRCARAGFEKGDKRLFSSPRYVGTMVWHRALGYAAAWLGASSLALAMDSVALVQHVKCSPMGGRRSNPTPSMWNHCGAHVLGGELAILKPTKIIVLGRGNNASRLRALLGGTTVVRTQRVQLGKRTASLHLERSKTSAIDLVVVPHPASLGGTARALGTAFSAVVRGGTV